MLTMSILQDSSETARLHLDSTSLGIAGRIGATVIDISAHFSPERDRVERFIRQVYAITYHADIDIHYPTLMSMRTESGEILAAIGFRYAAEETLFLERYTDQPIEQCISAGYGKTIVRNDIAEIGNLASTGSGASIYLFAALSSYLNAHYIRYAAITGTQSLHKRFCKLGLQPRALCAADPTRLLEADCTRWGTYYEQNPQVYCGSVEEGVQHLREALGVIYEETALPPLVSRLHYKRSL